MHRLGRQKKLYLSYLRTAIIAVLFLVVAIPFVNKVANGGKTYTPEDRYMVVLNGQELGCVSDITIAQEALKDARNQVNAANKGVALVESDIKIFKETAGGVVVSKEALSESIYSTLMSAAVDTDSFKSAYTVRIDDFTVTLGSKDEVIQLFERVKDKYSSSNEFTVELVENSDGSYASFVTNFVSADVSINEAAQVLATLNGNIIKIAVAWALFSGNLKIDVNVGTQIIPPPPPQNPLTKPMATPIISSHRTLKILFCFLFK